MKISKRVREEAALICAISASGRHFATYVCDVADWLAVPQRSGFIEGSRPAELAFRAISYVERARKTDDERSRGWHRENAAEAEALLRTGWSPE